MLTTAQLKAIQERIECLRTQGFEKAIECTFSVRLQQYQLNAEQESHEKKNHDEILKLYQQLVDDGYPAHAHVVNTIERYLMLTEAMSLSPMYLHEDQEQGKHEKSELLKRLANSIYLAGECIDDLLDYEDQKNIPTDFETQKKHRLQKERAKIIESVRHPEKFTRQEKTSMEYGCIDEHAEQTYRSETALRLLKKANETVQKPETLCLIGEIYLDNKDYKTAETYFKKAILIDKEHPKAYLDLARMVEMTDGTDAAISVLEYTLRGGIDNIEIRLALQALCVQALKSPCSKDKRVHYIGLAREQTGIIHDKIVIYGNDALFDDETSE